MEEREERRTKVEEEDKIQMDGGRGADRWRNMSAVLWCCHGAALYLRPLQSVKKEC